MLLCANTSCRIQFVALDKSTTVIQRTGSQSEDYPIHLRNSISHFSEHQSPSAQSPSAVKCARHLGICLEIFWIDFVPISIPSKNVKWAEHVTTLRNVFIDSRSVLAQDNRDGRDDIWSKPKGVSITPVNLVINDVSGVNFKCGPKSAQRNSLLFHPIPAGFSILTWLHCRQHISLTSMPVKQRTAILLSPR